MFSIEPPLPVTPAPENLSTVDPSTTPQYAVIYLRVSTAGQSRKGDSEEGFSIPAQREATRRTAATLGAFVVKEFIDAGASGTTTKRSGLQQMLAYVEENPIDYVVVHKLDRLARNRSDDSSITGRLRNAGARLVSSSESIDPTPGGELVHGIMASIAEFYSRNLSNEVMKGLAQKHQSGGTPGKAPLGYRNVRATGANGAEYRTVEIDEPRAALLKWAFHAYATGESSLREITDSLNLLGLRTRDAGGRPGNEMRINLVHRILRNPYYKGIVCWNGAGHPGSHTPLVDERTWQRAQEQLAARRNTQGKRARHPHHLSRVLKCGECNYSMVVSNARSRSGKIYRYFVCSGRTNRRSGCKIKAVLIETVEQLVEALYAEMSLTPEERSARSRRVGRQDAYATSAEQEQTSSEGTAIKQRKILDAYYQGAITIEVLQVELESLSAPEPVSRENATRSSEAVQRELRLLELREDLTVKYAEASSERRHAMHLALFGRLKFSRDEVGRAQVTPVQQGSPLLKQAGSEL